MCRINTSPKITGISISPQSCSVFDENIVLTLKATVIDREGLADILSVKADLSNLGGPPDAEMKSPKGDNEYILRFNPKNESWGEKTVTVTVTDKSGATGSDQTSETVVR
jgi:hypothetical protein